MLTRDMWGRVRDSPPPFSFPLAPQDAIISQECCKDNLALIAEVTCSVIFLDTRFVIIKCIGERAVTLR